RLPSFFICLLSTLVVFSGCTAAAEDDQASAAVPAKGAKRSTPAVSTSRKAGSDWPCFLGLTGDSKSSETGILNPWPAKGPKIVWQTKLGAGYSAPVISQGRLFQFSRYADQVRLTCLESETGNTLWQQQYASDFEDLYGYDNGPRCCPIVDEDRVYAYGPEGKLHCFRVSDGQPLWMVDTRTTFGVIQH